MEAGSPGLALPSPFRSDPRPKVAPFWSECAERRRGGQRGCTQRPWSLGTPAAWPVSSLRPWSWTKGPPHAESEGAAPEPGGAGSAFPSPSPSGQGTGCRTVPGLSTAAADSETPAKANAGPAIGTLRLGAGSRGRGAERGGAGSGSRGRARTPRRAQPSPLAGAARSRPSGRLATPTGQRTPAPRAASPRPQVARGSDVTARWRRLLQAAEGEFRPGRSESIRGGERASVFDRSRSRAGGARTVPSAPYCGSGSGWAPGKRW